jgi:hypothetical protein
LLPVVAEACPRVVTWLVLAQERGHRSPRARRSQQRGVLVEHQRRDGHLQMHVEHPTAAGCAGELE